MRERQNDMCTATGCAEKASIAANAILNGAYAVMLGAKTLP